MGAKNSISKRNKSAIKSQYATTYRSVPTMNDYPYLNKPSVAVSNPSLRRKASMKVGQDGEKLKPDGAFSEYIDNAGSRIRGASGSTAGATIRRENLDHRVSGYISRAKRNFHEAPSFVDNGNNNNVA